MTKPSKDAQEDYEASATAAAAAAAAGAAETAAVAAAAAAAVAAAAAAAVAAAPPLPLPPSVAQTFQQTLAVNKLQRFLSDGRNHAMQTGNSVLEKQYVEMYQNAVGTELQIGQTGSFGTTAPPPALQSQPQPQPFTSPWPHARPPCSVPFVPSAPFGQQHFMPQSASSSAPASNPGFDPYTGQPHQGTVTATTPSFCTRCGVPKVAPNARFCSRCGANF